MALRPASRSRWPPAPGRTHAGHAPRRMAEIRRQDLCESAAISASALRSAAAAAPRERTGPRSAHAPAILKTHRSDVRKLAAQDLLPVHRSPPKSAGFRPGCGISLLYRSCWTHPPGPAGQVSRGRCHAALLGLKHQTGAQFQPRLENLPGSCGVLVHEMSADVGRDPRGDECTNLYCRRTRRRLHRPRIRGHPTAIRPDLVRNFSNHTEQTRSSPACGQDQIQKVTEVGSDTRRTLDAASQAREGPVPG
jgi:hypothetical protein